MKTSELRYILGFPGCTVAKNPHAMQENQERWFDSASERYAGVERDSTRGFLRGKFPDRKSGNL